MSFLSMPDPVIGNSLTEYQNLGLLNLARFGDIKFIKFLNRWKILIGLGYDDCSTCSLALDPAHK